MITPLDIQNKEFGKAVRGYKEEDVDMFLDLITLDLEKILKENRKLKAEVESLQSDLSRYQGAENEVVRVLEQAQQLMGDISSSAEKRAEILVQNAELDAEVTLREARVRAERLRDENKHLEIRYANFRNKYKKMLEDELHRFEHLREDLFPEFDDEVLEELVNEPLNNGAKEEEFDAKKSDSSISENTYRGEEPVNEKTVVLNSGAIRGSLSEK